MCIYRRTTVIRRLTAQQCNDNNYMNALRNVDTMKKEKGTWQRQKKKEMSEITEAKPITLPCNFCSIFSSVLHTSDLMVFL